MSKQQVADLEPGRTMRLWVRKSQQAKLLKTLQQQTSLYLKVDPKVGWFPNPDPSSTCTFTTG